MVLVDKGVEPAIVALRPVPTVQSSVCAISIRQSAWRTLLLRLNKVRLKAYRASKIAVCSHQLVCFKSAKLMRQLG